MNSIQTADLLKSISSGSKGLVTSHHMLLQVPRKLSGDLHDMFMSSVATYYSHPEEPALARKILTGYSGMTTVTVPTQYGESVAWVQAQGYVISHAFDYFKMLGLNPGQIEEYDMSKELIANQFLTVSCGLSRTAANMAISRFQTFRGIKAMKPVSQTLLATELLQFVDRQGLVKSSYRRLITSTLNTFYSKVERIEGFVSDGHVFLAFGTRRKTVKGFGHFICFTINAEKLRDLELGMQELVRIHQKDS